MLNRNSLRILSALFGAMAIFLAFAGLVPQRANAAGEVIYVDHDASGSNDGSSWGDAYVSLQSALNVADDGDEIWVASGVYTPGVNREDNFQLLSGVAIYGGFVATETVIAERDWVEHETVLSGNIVSVEPSVAPAVASGNSFHVVVGSGVDASSVLDGFTISQGNADGTSPQNKGGGMYNSGGSPTLNNLKFVGNSAQFGGGLYNSGSSPKLTNVTFNGNSAVKPDPEDFANGGGMANYALSNPILENVVFVENSADSSGGGIANYEGSILTITGGHFSSNDASSQGGGLRNSNQAEATLINVLFEGNDANLNGGAISTFDETELNIINGTFTYNSAGDSGGALRIAGNSHVSLVNSILWSNYYDLLDVRGSVSALDAEPAASISFDVPTESVPTSTAKISFSLIQGSGGSENWNAAFGSDLGNNIDQDPMFADLLSSAENDVESNVYLYNRFALLPLSPAIDSGSNVAFTSATSATTDLAQNDRIDTTTIDMGAYEYQYSCTSGSVLYVDENSPSFFLFDEDENRGSSWELAYRDLQLALFEAAGCANITEIRVADGAYTPGNDPSDSFQLQNNLAIYGGYLGYVDTGARIEGDLRNPLKFRTTLSGDIDSNDGFELLRFPGGDSGINGQNSYHVVDASGVDHTAVLDGFYISGGNAHVETVPEEPLRINVEAESPVEYDNMGGGLISIDGSATLSNLYFAGNLAHENGGAIASISSTLTISNSEFTNNAAGHGGAIYNTAGDSAIYASYFEYNLSEYHGGALYNVTATLTISDSSFAYNTAYGHGGAIYNENGDSIISEASIYSNNAVYGSGGGIYSAASSPVITGVCITNNNTGPRIDDVEVTVLPGRCRRILEASSASAAAMSILVDEEPEPLDGGKGGGLYASSGNPILKYVSFQGNRADHGGGMYSKDANPVIDRGYFSGNNVPGSLPFFPVVENLVVTTHNGGAIFNDNSNPQITDSSFDYNMAENDGGAIYNLESTVVVSQTYFYENMAFKGGGVYNESSDFTVTFGSFDMNVASVDGGGMYNSSSSTDISNTWFYGNIAADEGGGVYNADSPMALLNSGFEINEATTSFGGAIANYDGSDGLYTNVSIARNGASTGGHAIYNNDSSPTIVNSILWNNSLEALQDEEEPRVAVAEEPNPILNNAGSTPSIRYSIVENSGDSGDDWNDDMGIDGGNNLGSDPLFENDGSFYLALGSPALDSGDNAAYNSDIDYDLDENLRLVNGIIDMGAIEGQYYLLNVLRDGNGSGIIESADLASNINCGITCTEHFEQNEDSPSVVTLEPLPDTGSEFAGWSGACSGMASCVITMTQMAEVTGTFNLITYPVTTITIDDGKSGGSVEINPAGDSFDYGSVITVTAVPTVGSKFLGWEGSVSGTTNPITVTVDQAKTLTATFGIESYAVELNVGGTGDGVVNKFPNQEVYEYGTEILIIATADDESTFTGWTGDLTGVTNPYTLTVDGPKVITATMTEGSNVLAVTKAGTGNGLVVSDPAGIDCGLTCAINYAINEVVTLTATADNGSTFNGWSGACSGLADCSITMDSLKYVTATFTANVYDLTVTVDGAGEGTIKSTPAGIDCGSTCSYEFNHDEIVTLTATSAEGSSFFGWSGGGCSGTGTCIITMDQAKSVRAIFALIGQPNPPTEDDPYFVYLPIIVLDN